MFQRSFVLMYSMHSLPAPPCYTMALSVLASLVYAYREYDKYSLSCSLLLDFFESEIVRDLTNKQYNFYLPTMKINNRL